MPYYHGSSLLLNLGVELGGTLRVKLSLLTEIYGSFLLRNRIDGSISGILKLKNKVEEEDKVSGIFVLINRIFEEDSITYGDFYFSEVYGL